MPSSQHHKSQSTILVKTQHIKALINFPHQKDVHIFPQLPPTKPLSTHARKIKSMIWE